MMKASQVRSVIGVVTHAPPQPPNREPPVGVAVNVTVLPFVKSPSQFAPQLIPAGLEVTVPAPRPVFSTWTVRMMAVNVAVTVMSPGSEMMVQVRLVPALAHAPDQPLNVAF